MLRPRGINLWQRPLVLYRLVALVRVTLREITAANERAVRALRTTTAQEKFVSTVDYALREAERNPQDNPWLRAVYADEQPVGLVMVAWDIVPDPPHTAGPYFLWKLIVDQQHQGNGYGRDTVEQVINLLREDGAAELLTSYIEGEGGGVDPLAWTPGCCGLRLRLQW